MADVNPLKLVDLGSGEGELREFASGDTVPEAAVSADLARLASPAFTGTPTAPTQSSSDNSTKLATTAWAKAGFAVSIAITGYIKFPSWLGGLVIQWGRTASALDAGGGQTISFPIAFPNSRFCLIPVVASTWVSAREYTCYSSWGNTSLVNFDLYVRRQESSGDVQNANPAPGTELNIQWIAIGA